MTVHSGACRSGQTMRCIASLSFCLICVTPIAAESDDAFGQARYADMRIDRSSVLAAYQAALGETPDAPDADMQQYGYRWRGSPPDQPDWPGLRRDTAYFVGYQFVTVAALYAAPESVSGWDDDEKSDYSFKKWGDNVTNPVWDEDRWWLNYVLHPYWGGAYYIRGRERGLDRLQAFWYSALLSTMFEYGAEALYEPVSIQDVVITPVVGFLVGEYLFTPWRERIRAKSGNLDWSDKAALFITDPLGVLNAEADRVLGVKTTMQWQLVNNVQAPALAGGVGVSNPLPEHTRGAEPVWGIQVRIDW
jgi:hypothetical protein